MANRDVWQGALKANAGGR